MLYTLILFPFLGLLSLACVWVLLTKKQGKFAHEVLRLSKTILAPLLAALCFAGLMVCTSSLVKKTELSFAPIGFLAFFGFHFAIVTHLACIIFIIRPLRTSGRCSWKSMLTIGFFVGMAVMFFILASFGTFGRVSGIESISILLMNSIAGAVMLGFYYFIDTRSTELNSSSF